MNLSTDERFYGLAVKVASERSTPAEKAELDAILASEPARVAQFEEVKENVAFTVRLAPRIYEELIEVPPLAEKYRQRFHQKVAEVFGPPKAAQPVVQELTRKQMEALLLKILSERPMDGLDLTRALERTGFRLKDEGEGLIYGILSSLESSSHLEGRWREQGTRMIKTYHITEKGSGLLQRQAGTAGQLSAWSQAVLAFDPNRS